MNKQGTRQPAKQPVRPGAKSLKQTRQEKRREEQLRREEEQRQAARAKRNTIIGIVAAVVLIAAISIIVVLNNQQSTSPYPAVDGITCDQGEHTDVHYHAHLTIYIDGQQMQAPANTGIVNNACFYWMHVHSADGIIHIESPAAHTFTLGNFFDIWRRQFPYLGNGFPSQLNQPGWTVYVDGKVYNGDFHKIVLQSHTLVTMAYDSPNAKPDTTYSWNGL